MSTTARTTTTTQGNDNGMDVEMIMAGKEIMFSVAKGADVTYDDAVARMKAFQEAAGLEGLGIKWEDEFERHAHGPRTLKVRRMVSE